VVIWSEAINMLIRYVQGRDKITIPPFPRIRM